MNKVIKLFKNITSGGEITIVQKGFLYSDKVDTRKEELTFNDFIILTRYLLKNQYLKISFEVKGKENVDNILTELKKLGISVEVLRNELSWIVETEMYEVDVLFSIKLSENKIQSLIERFYVVEDAVLVYPVGYMSWDSYFNQKSIAV